MKLWPALTVAFLALPGTVTAADHCSSDANFMVKGATAIDRRSGLEWQRCALGRQWSGTNCKGDARMMSLDQAKAEAAKIGSGWRLPSVKEMAGLLDDNCRSNKAPMAIFADTEENNPEGDPYWTSSPVGMAGLWYYVDLQNGDIDGHSPQFSLSVRLARPSR